jgi:hypothetical protein
LQREMGEETGIDITPAAINPLDDRGTGKAKKRLADSDEIVLCYMKFFTYRIAFDRPAAAIKTQPGDDFVMVKWFAVNRLPAVLVTPPSASLFKRLGIL